MFIVFFFFFFLMTFTFDLHSCCFAQRISPQLSPDIFTFSTQTQTHGSGVCCTRTNGRGVSQTQIRGKDVYDLNIVVPTGVTFYWIVTADSYTHGTCSLVCQSQTSCRVYMRFATVFIKTKGSSRLGQMTVAWCLFSTWIPALYWSSKP